MARKKSVTPKVVAVVAAVVLKKYNRLEKECPRVFLFLSPGYVIMKKTKITWG